MTKNSLIYLLIHILFCLLFTYWFYNNSMIRPVCINSLYKEIISAGIVLMLVYVNYFILVPKVLMKNLYIMYIFLSLLLIFTCGIIELYMVESDIAQCVKNAFPSENLYRKYIHSGVMDKI